MTILTVLRRRWGYALVLLPVLTDWIAGHLPTTRREVLSEVILGTAFAVCIRLIYRDQDLLQIMAETDVLTGLGNRRQFLSDVDRAVAAFTRAGTPVALGYADIDHFKTVNDVLGHAEGDATLRRAAQILGRSVRSFSDRCYRLGGDEFALLVLGAVSDDLAQIGNRLESHWLKEEERLQGMGVRISLGWAVAQAGDTPQTLLARADRAMYTDKGTTTKGSIAVAPPPDAL